MQSRQQLDDSRRAWHRDLTAHASESGAAATSAGAVNSMAALLAGQILRDGELVLLILRPSRWFILLSSLRFLAIVAILMILAAIFDDRVPGHSRQYVEAGVFVMVGRLMWAVLQWMSRLYVLTDLRILRLSGVFTVNVFECALRRVARAMLDVTFKERLCRVGSIVIIPQDQDKAPGIWQMIGRPREVHERVLAAISKAKH